MLEENPTPAEPGRVTPEYSYPGDLARFVRDRWRAVPEPLGGADPLPDAAALEGFFDACYQASMLREEERPAVFRATLAEPELSTPREIRRLSVASDPQRALIGVRQDGEGDLRIWGMVNSGTRWLRDIQAGTFRSVRA